MTRDDAKFRYADIGKNKKSEWEVEINSNFT